MADRSTRDVPFQVDIAGIIEIMGSSLYSRPDTPIRELIQNAHDAIMRRRAQDLTFTGRIDIRQHKDAHTLEFEDDGVGLSATEAEQYLGTLGRGITGFLKGRHAAGPAVPRSSAADNGDLIGQFGIGLFSGFMLADRIVVDSRRSDSDRAVRWSAAGDAGVTLAESPRTRSGTCVTLHLKPTHHRLAADEAWLEQAVREFADFLSIPIHLNDAATRINVINAPWLDPTPDAETIELELESTFGETPLDVIPVRTEKPVSIAGALYISPQRVPGFSRTASLMVTVRRMVISRAIRDLVPAWASFVRGILELSDCAPTASREDLVRNEQFELVRSSILDCLYQHLEGLVQRQPDRLQAIVDWHRYTLAGAALEDERLRALLRQVYTLPTSAGRLTINQLLQRCPADPLVEAEVDRVLWYNTDRRQEHWMNQLFNDQETVCVHAFRSFEEGLLAAIVADENAGGSAIDLRIASATATNFSETILGVRDLQEPDDHWHDFFRETQARVLVGSLHTRVPVVAFLNERSELSQAFQELKNEGKIPGGFQRLIDSHFAAEPADRNEVILNQSHRLVQRVLSQRPGTPLASVLRLLVLQALNTAGSTTPESARRQQSEDLDWIAEALWGQDA